MSPRVRRHNPSSRTSLSSLLNSALGMLIPAQRLQSGDAIVAHALCSSRPASGFWVPGSGAQAFWVLGSPECLDLPWNSYWRGVRRKTCHAEATNSHAAPTCALCILHLSACVSMFLACPRLPHVRFERREMSGVIVAGGYPTAALQMPPALGHVSGCHATRLACPLQEGRGQIRVCWFGVLCLLLGQCPRFWAALCVKGCGGCAPKVLC